MTFNRHTSPAARPASRRRLRLCRDGFLIAAVMAIALLASACSGGSASSQHSAGSAGSGSRTFPKRGNALAFSQCMRSHGVQNFPDPGANGRVQLRVGGSGGVNPNSPGFQAAQQACQSLLPAGKRAGGSLSPAQQSALLRYARCMRSHGLANFRDPTFSGGAVNLNPAGIDTSSSQYQAAQQACQSLLPFGGGGG